ncbi:MAG: helix-turn-helix transcriptional regulator [Desulfovibrio sp.]|uniref:helix-turn-helix domain-containing protein n=1 Tax=Desulfovibrio sp. TaxID=885 RepID=UPI002590FFB9|nr:helix-turn-helix transcriptional regulator [Desulfovibrio sp.]MCD7982755.1 helix-turn-helix transcriptional regulator [Desulfovibrio sp.]
MIKSNLKEIMERLDVTYKQLEEKTGVSSQTITRARGEMISECRLSTLETIAKALGVTTKDLYDEKI